MPWNTSNTGRSAVGRSRSRAGGARSRFDLPSHALSAPPGIRDKLGVPTYSSDPVEPVTMMRMTTPSLNGDQRLVNTWRDSFPVDAAAARNDDRNSGTSNSSVDSLPDSLTLPRRSISIYGLRRK